MLNVPLKTVNKLADLSSPLGIAGTSKSLYICHGFCASFSLIFQGNKKLWHEKGPNLHLSMLNTREERKKGGGAKKAVRHLTGAR